ncbi:response regulator [Microvirga lotononidis]|uniref:Response regulator containing CheY-like receiver domain and AraC-type DNA-binding domain n=1 Tax=Microvirga lotononidis TaxID=864069 RepID=I4Z2E5_9HYPH|nr:response regulator [Microvirga lotononidis]EIM30387.1 response regulator containing CheY-like receiver domain and AraC-type DNA-binding domain [Microvirga lotononidis]WQO30888.1 response regulator [Microvirga lotononidis]
MQTARGPRVLIVEDETLVSMLIEDMVGDCGGYVVGPAATFEQAIAIALDEDLDLAILDVNVAGLVVYPVADILRHRGIPFMFVTGYDSSIVPARYQHERVLMKPFSYETFSDAFDPIVAERRAALAI